LEIVIEEAERGPEIHLHPAGQGFWIARMVRTLGVPVTVCSVFGGETGSVARSLMEELGLHIRHIKALGWSGCVVLDHRGPKEIEMAAASPAPLHRHELDDLYGMALIEGLGAIVTVLGGPDRFPETVNPDVYYRLAHDLQASGHIVMADLSGEPLAAAVRGGVPIVKVSSEELESMGLVKGQSLEELTRAIDEFVAQGVEQVIVSRGNEGVLARIDDRLLLGRAPKLEAVDPRGAGDSLTGGFAAGIARGDDQQAALCLGVAAGALNATRHGLASGTQEEIERLTEHVLISEA
jgi:1-phosphofructokinase